MAFKGQVHYFSVGKSSVQHATVWRLWNPKGKSDVYLGPRFAAKTFKLSIHETGVRLLREKPVSPLPNTEPPPNVMRWFGPPREMPGHEVVWQIVTPFGALRDAKLAPRFTQRVTWIPQTAHPYTATEFLIILSFGLIYPDSRWPGSEESPRIDCLLRWRLPNDETLFLLRRTIPLTAEQSLSWGHALIRTRLPEGWEREKRNFDHRALLFLDDTGGFHGCVDLAYDV